jgi:hypothetical protein
MNKCFVLLTCLIVFASSCKKDPDRAGAYEGTFVAPFPTLNFDRVKVTKVDNKTVSFAYSFKDSSQFLLIPTATFTSDTTLSFDLQSNVSNKTPKYMVIGTAAIYTNRLSVIGKATNVSDSFDYYNISFEGYR